MVGVGRAGGRGGRGRNGSASEWLWARWTARWSGRWCGPEGWHRQMSTVGGRRRHRRCRRIRPSFPLLQITLRHVNSLYALYHHHQHVQVKHLVGFWIYYPWIVTIKIKSDVVDLFRIHCETVQVCFR